METNFSKVPRPYFFARFKNKLGFADGILHISRTKNNTLLTLTEPRWGCTNLN